MMDFAFRNQLKIEAGAHIKFFARQKGPLDEAKDEIVAARRDANQEVHAVSLDLGNPSEVQWTFSLKSTMPRRKMADYENSLMRSSDLKFVFQMVCIV